jgi:hypothetical protein
MFILKQTCLYLTLNEEEKKHSFGTNVKTLIYCVHVFVLKYIVQVLYMISCSIV